MAPNPEPNRNLKTFRLLAIAAGVWFLGSGIWGLLTEGPQDRAVARCEALARAQAEPDAVVQHAAAREDRAGWVVTGEVRPTADGAVAVTWECLAEGDGRNPAITAWTPAA
ncbi:MAG: hypothetical protein QM804_13390 [Propionicimonas sp.]